MGMTIDLNIQEKEVKWWVVCAARHAYFIMQKKKEQQLVQVDISRDKIKSCKEQPRIYIFIPHIHGHTNFFQEYEYAIVQRYQKGKYKISIIA